ncbi:uncharacterized protein LODBEIA_P16660 [Lodderomyces beijingensis]|uniref:Mediator of RNA polymerase II transcription subunit 5 n=1 Tax=Lodderomyces beijingensis TaxID=1775926 RepID=A0ABP0ZMM7_9ASCO
MAHKAAMSQDVTPATLLDKAVEKKLSTKTYILLSIQLNSKHSIDDDAFVQLLKPVNVSTSGELEDHRLHLLAESSLTTKSNAARFWSNLIKIDHEFQARYLAAFRNVLLKSDLVNQEVLKSTVYEYLPSYVHSYLDKHAFLQSVLDQIAMLMGVLMDHHSDLVIQKAAETWDKLLVKFILSASQYNSRSHSLTRVRSKSMSILSQGSLQKLEDMSLSRTEDASEGGTGQFADVAPFSLTIHNKLDSYLSIKSLYWIHQFTKDFQQLQQLEEPGVFLKYFISEFISPQRQSDKHHIARSLCEALAATLNVAGFHLFNVKNFLLTRVPPIFQLLKIDHEESIKIVSEKLPNSDANFKSVVVDAVADAVGSKTKEFVELSTQLRFKFSEELANINSGFTSLDENGLVLFLRDLPKSLTTYQSQKAASYMILGAIDELMGLGPGPGSKSKEQEKLSRFLLVLMNNIELLNIIVYNTNLDLVKKLIDYTDYDQFSIDPDEDEFQELYSYCGIALLSILVILEVFSVDISKIDIKNSFSVTFINSFYYRFGINLTNRVPAEIDEEDSMIVANYNTLVSEWVGALFNESNDGLSDELMKSLNVKQIYKLVPVLYKQAIEATNIGKISFASLSNGLDYLSQIFLIPVGVCLIHWMLRDPLIKRDLKSKIITDFINTNLQGPGDSSTLMLKMILNIVGPEILKSRLLSAQLSELVAPHLHYQVQPSASDKIWNIRENFKNIFSADKSQSQSQLTPIFNSFDDYLLHNQFELAQFVVQELYTYQTESNEENLKLFINLMISIFIWNSVRNASDGAYWKEVLNETTIASSEVVPATSEPPVPDSKKKKFSLSMDNHYSSIFNDESNPPTAIKDEFDEMGDFLNSNDDDDDDGKDRDADVEMNVPTSEILTESLSRLRRDNCLLAQFRRIKSATTRTSLFFSTVKIMNERILEELSSCEV